MSRLGSMRHSARNLPPLALLFLAIVMSWLSFTIFSMAEREQLITDEVRNNKILLDRLQAQIEHSYRNDDLHWIQQSLGSLGAKNEILRVALVTSEKAILADMNRSNIGRLLSVSLEPLTAEQSELQQRMLVGVAELRSGEIYRSLEANFLGAVYPLVLVETDGVVQRGLLWMESDLRRSKALAQEQIKLQTIALMIGFSFLALCLGLVYHFVVTRRINKLVNTMSRVADGDLDARVNISSSDEFGRLGFYFNEMLDRRKAVEGALHQSRKLESIGTLASGIAHDFNNILQAITGYVRLAQTKVEDGQADLSRYLEKIELGSARATTLVKRILSFSRSSNVNFQSVRMQQVIAESLELLATAIPPDVHVARDIDARCRPVHADLTQLQQVVSNLLTNAIHAVDEKSGKIDISLRQTDVSEPRMTLTGRLAVATYAELVIQDNGKGIASEHFDQLLDPFFTTKEVGKGTGLGLSIVHGVVKHSNGGLTIESTAGRGTRVTVYLPVSNRSAETVDASQAESGPNAVVQASSRHAVLLVDDEEEIAHSSTLLLREKGYAVELVTTVESAIAITQEQEFDVAVLDYTMPGMNGLELAERLNVSHAMPIILVTGLLERDETSGDIPQCVQRIIRKPYAIDDLASAIEASVGK